jgi:polygalacturonase
LTPTATTPTASTQTPAGISASTSVPLARRTTAIKSGKGEEGRRLARPCEDVTVTDCTFNAGHGAISIGSEVSGGVRGVHVERCTVKKGVACALRIKSAEGRGGFIEDVTAKDLDSAAGQAVQVDINVK